MPKPSGSQVHAAARRQHIEAMHTPSGCSLCGSKPSSVRPLPDRLGPLPSSEEGGDRDVPSAGLFPCTQPGLSSPCSPSAAVHPHKFRQDWIGHSSCWPRQKMSGPIGP